MASWNDPDVTEQVEAFLAPLAPVPAQPMQAIVNAIDYVAEHGPAARRPILGEVALLPDFEEHVPLFGKRLHEIVPLSTHVRIICIFSPERTLVLLYAGDKEGDWNRWYRTAIPQAAGIYREYLEERGLR